MSCGSTIFEFSLRNGGFLLVFPQFTFDFGTAKPNTASFPGCVMQGTPGLCSVSRKPGDT